MKKRIISAVIILILAGTTLACTIPLYFATEPEEKIVYVEVTAAPQEEEADPVEAESAQEAIAPVSMDGPWTIWQGSDEQKLSIDFLQKGFEIIGNASTDDGHSMMFAGVISSDGKSVSGNWESTNGNSGNFTMAMNDALNSFSGNLGGGVPFCGTRMSNSKPYPCLK